jgi:MerR family redox-sensitive transcriptional activator SoxR
VIKAAQKMGVSLEEIRGALATLPESRTPTTEDWERLSTHWRQDLDDRIAYLQRLRDLLTGCIGCGCLSMKNCPIYNENDKLAAEADGAVLLERAGKSVPTSETP